MYDRPETEAANDRLWTLFRKALGHGPDRLTRDGDYHWTDPALLLSQTCSLPVRTFLRGKVTLVAAPVFDIDCENGNYFSHIVVRADDTRDRLEDFADATLAISGPDSHSGWGSIRSMFAPFRVLVTGAHRESARAIAEGRADLAAIDANTWRMIARWDETASHLKVIGRTPSSPATPYITAHGNDPAPIRAALAEAVDALSDEDRDLLGLLGVTDASEVDYLALPIPEAPCLSD